MIPCVNSRGEGSRVSSSINSGVACYPNVKSKLKILFSVDFLSLVGVLFCFRILVAVKPCRAAAPLWRPDCQPDS